eukprot:NODE_240_length_11935_cov_0.818773.p7 type:complete len:262 gc:universal NODE_240_length_11935_cov_0.818773:9309-8524(-)
MELLDDSFWQNLYEDEQADDIADYWTFDAPVEEGLDIGFGYQMPMDRVDMEQYLQQQLDEPLAPDVLEIVKAMVNPFVGNSDELDLKCLDYSTLCDLYNYMQGVEQNLEEQMNAKLEAKKKGVQKKKQPKKVKKAVEAEMANTPTPSVEESLFLDFDMPIDVYNEIIETPEVKKKPKSKKKKESIPIQTPVKRKNKTEESGPQVPIVPVAFPRIRFMGGFSPFGTMNHCPIPVTPLNNAVCATTANPLIDLYEEDEIDILN